MTVKKEIKCDLCEKLTNEYYPMLSPRGGRINICRTCAIKEGVLEETEEEILNSIKLIEPIEIHRRLDKVVVGQDEAKRDLSIEIYNHLLRLKNKEKLKAKGKKVKKNNILLTGVSGCGKTLLGQTIAEIIEVPFTIYSATSLTESGYTGEDVENLLVSLLEKTDFNVKRAEKGIIFIDEVDKIAKKGENMSLTKDVSGEGVQQSLLKMVEADFTKVPPNGGRKHPQQAMITVNTEDILFIAGGAFVGIEEIVEERLRNENKENKTIGFAANTSGNKKRTYTTEELRANIETQDLKKFGMIPEFLGRFPVLSNLEPLSVEHLVEILKLNNGILDEFVTYFDMLDKQLIFEDEALEEVAKVAIQKGTGARGLRSILKSILKDLQYIAPSEPNVTEYIITKNEVVKKYENKLEKTA